MFSLLLLCLLQYPFASKVLILLTGHGNRTQELKDFLNNYSSFKSIQSSFHAQEVDQKDSASFTTNDWNNLANTISENYDDYQSFVVVHGFGMVEYTSAYLSFFFGLHTKTIVVTTFQLLPSEGYTDFVSNVFGAWKLASNQPNISQVLFYSENTVYLGTRFINIDATAIAAFASPNYPPVGIVRDTVDINSTYLMNDASNLRSSFGKSNATDCVSMVFFYPGMQTSTIQGLLDQSRGAVLLAFGVGNGPTTDENLFNLLKNKTGDGLVVVDTTQCYNGRVDLGVYATGDQMAEAGCIGGGDMTPACAFAKLVYLLSTDTDSSSIRQKMLQNLVGELTQTVSAPDASSSTTSQSDEKNTTVQLSEESPSKTTLFTS